MKFWTLLLMTATLAVAQRRGAINVEHYNIDAEINPRTNSLAATAEIRLAAADDRVSALTFELNNSLRVSRAVDETGQSLAVSKGPQDGQVTVSLAKPIAKGAPGTVKITYDGVLAGEEESPVYGIKFAVIQPERTFLLYPARWFPINEYTADRYTMTLRATVPTEYRVLSNGFETKTAAGAKTTYNFEFRNPGFPGNLALVQGQPKQVTSQGVTSTFWLNERADMASAYGEEAAKIMTYYGSQFGVPPVANLTFVETVKGAPSGYSTPGMIFLSPGGIGSQVNARLLANQMARQWWGNQVSHATRNHLWITNGLARYSEFLYVESQNGPGPAELELRDLFTEALTSEQIPLIQSARLEDYSPELVAATSAKGAAVYAMLRQILGDQKFGALLKELASRYAGKSINTEEFKNLASQVADQDMQYFFVEWIESAGAPEFKLEYTVFRTAKGFRVVGKVSQDLDTFRMPVELKIETEGNPEFKTVEVVGTSSEFVVETFGKPARVILDPNNRVLRYSDSVRVAVAIRRGEQFAEIGEYGEALKEYQKALDVQRISSIAHYRVGEVFLNQTNYQAAANEFREALNGDLEPKWVEVWSHINLGKIFDITGQRERAVNEYNLAIRTKDNTQGGQEEAAKYLKEPYKRPARVD